MIQIADDVSAFSSHRPPPRGLLLRPRRMERGTVDTLTERFEQERPRLRAVAYRMLGSASEADDAVQEAWLRFDRTDVSEIENVGAWLTTVVARLCLSMLRTRRNHPEEPLDGRPEPGEERR